MNATIAKPKQSIGLGFTLIELLLVIAIIKRDGVGGGGRDPASKDAPQHQGGKSFVPEGGNQVFAAGAARWIKITARYYLHSWTADDSRKCYLFQESSDFVVALQN